MTPGEAFSVFLIAVATTGGLGTLIALSLRSYHQNAIRKAFLKGVDCGWNEAADILELAGAVSYRNSWLRAAQEIRDLGWMLDQEEINDENEVD